MTVRSVRSAARAGAISTQYMELAHFFRMPDQWDGSPVGQRADRREPSRHVHAFDQSISKYACSLYEGSYIDGARAALFEELIRVYRYFGLQRADNAELPDHLSVELEFMHFLTYWEASLVLRAEPSESLCAAQGEFLRRHLRVVAGGVSRSYAGGDSGFRKAIAELCALVEAQTEALGPCIGKA